MDEQYIINLYNQLGGQKEFGTFENFKSVISTDTSYQKNFHSAFGEGTLGSFDNFVSLVSSQPAASKKKEGGIWEGFVQSLTDPFRIQEQQGSVSPSDQSSSVSPSPSFYSQLPQAGMQQGPPMRPADQVQPDYTKMADIEQATLGVVKPPQQVEVPFKMEEKPEDPLKEQMFQEMRKERKEGTEGIPKFAAEAYKEITGEFLKRSSNAVKNDLEYYLGDAGFTVDDSGYLTLVAPNGKRAPLKGADLKTVANEIKAFIKENITSVGADEMIRLQKEYNEGRKKFISEKQIEEELNTLNKGAQLLKDEINNTFKEETALFELQDQIESYPANQRKTAAYQTLVNDYNSRLNSFNENRSKLEEKIKQNESRDATIRRAAGDYLKNKEETGTFTGYLGRKFTDAVGSTLASWYNDFIDFNVGRTGNITGLMSDEKVEKLFKEKLKEKGYSEDADISESERKSLMQEIDAEQRDQLKKLFKYGKADGIDLGVNPKESIRAFFTEKFGPSSTTKEYTEYIDKEGNLLQRGIGGLAGSLPGMIGPPVFRVLNMFHLTSDAVMKEMEENPDFANISENEKQMVAKPIGIVGAALEEFGFRNLIKGKSIVTGLTNRILQKLPVNPTAAQIRAATMSELKAMGVKGGLAFVGSGLAEAETGLLQQVEEFGIKDIYNTIKDKEMFKTPVFMSWDYIYKVADAAATEAIGGFVMGVPNSISAAFEKDGFQGLSDDMFLMFEELSKSSDSKKLFAINLKNKINEGKITKAQAEKILDNYNNSVGLNSQILDDITDVGDRKKAMDLLVERKKLGDKKQGKDDALAKPIQDRIDAINNELTKISADAIKRQEQSTGIPAEISNLNDDEIIAFRVASLDDVPEEFRDKAREIGGGEIETRQLIFGLPFGKRETVTVPKAYVYSLTGKEAKEYAIQKQAAGEVPVQSEAGVGETMVQGEPQAGPQGITQKGVLSPEESKRKEELTNALAEAPSGATTISIGDTTMDRTEAQTELNGIFEKEQATPKVQPTKQATVEAFISAPIETKAQITFTSPDGKEIALEGNEQVAAQLYDEAVAVPTEQRTQQQNDIVEKMQPIVTVAMPVTEEITTTETTPVEQFTDQDRTRQQELKDALAKADKRRKNVIVGETTMSKADVKAELEALNKKEQTSTEAVERTAEEEADLLEELVSGKKKGKGKGKARARLSMANSQMPDNRNNEDAIVDEMNKMAPYEVDFQEPSPSDKTKEVDPVKESSSIFKSLTDLLKFLKDKYFKKNKLLRRIEDFNGIPMLLGMSDILAAGTILDSMGNEMAVDGGLLFNVLGRNMRLAWAGVNENGASVQLQNAKKVYNANRELFDRLWAEGKLPYGQIPMAIMRMSNTAINSNEAVFRYVLPYLKSLPIENRKAALQTLLESINKKKENDSGSNWMEEFSNKLNDGSIQSKEDAMEYLNGLLENESNATRAKSINAFINSIKPGTVEFSGENSVIEKLNEKQERVNAYIVSKFIEDNNIDTIDNFFNAIVKDAEARAQSEQGKSQLALPQRSYIFSQLFSKEGVNNPNTQFIKDLFNGIENPRKELFTASHIYNAIGEKSMLKSKQGDVVAIMGINVKENSGVSKADHNNYGFGPNGSIIALIKNPMHGIDVFPEFRAKASRIFKAKKKKELTKEQVNRKNALENALKNIDSATKTITVDGKEISVQNAQKELAKLVKQETIELPTMESVAQQTGGAFFMDKAFVGTTAKAEDIKMLDMLIGKLRYAFPGVSVTYTQEEFDSFMNQEGTKIKQSKDGLIIYGVTKDGKIFLNPAAESLRTPIHEFGHIWVDFLRSKASGKKGDMLLKKGFDLVRGTPEHLHAIELYGDSDLALEEALVELIATKGETLINAADRSNFKSWLNAVFKYIQEKFKGFKDVTQVGIKDMSLDDFINVALSDLFSGKEISSKFDAAKESSADYRYSLTQDIQTAIETARKNGISEEGIRIFLKRRGLDDAKINEILKTEPQTRDVKINESNLPGYDEMMDMVDAMIARQIKRSIPQDKIAKNLDALLRKFDAYINATDAQKKALEQEARNRIGAKQKKAPSFGRILGAFKDLTTLTTKDKKKIVSNLMQLAKDAAKDLAAEMKAMKVNGKITTSQLTAIQNRLSKVNFTNEVSINAFVDYMAKVFNDVEYANKMTEVRKLQAQVKSRKHMSMSQSVKQFISINPELIPDNMLLPYIQALDSMNTRTPSYLLMNKIYNDIISLKQDGKEFDEIKTIEAMAKKWESISLNAVKSVEEYVALIRDINSYKRKAYQLFENGTITQQQYETLMDAVGKDQDAVEKKYAKELKKIKDELIGEIDGLRPKENENLSAEENELISKYLETKKEDLETLSPEQLYVLRDLLENLKNGEFDYFRLSDIVSKLYTNKASELFNQELEQSNFDLREDQGLQRLAEYESSFWEGLLGLGRATSGALQKYIVTPFNRALASYEDFVQKSANVFIKLKDKYNIKDYDMYKLGMLTTYLQEYMAQFDPENANEPNIGTRDWFKEIINNESMRKKYKSKTGILRLVGMNRTEDEIIEKIWDSLPKDSNGNVDPKAVYDSYMANDGKYFTKNEKEFFDAVLEWKEKNLTDKQKAANELRGNPFKSIAFHMPKIRLLDGKKQIDAKSTSENNFVRLEAGTGKERTSQAVGPIMTNFEQLFYNNIEQTARDYYITKTLKDINNILSSAKRSLGQDKMTLLNVISGTLSDALNFEFESTKSNPIARGIMSAKVAEQLLDPIKTIRELIASFVSFGFKGGNLSGYKELFGKVRNMKDLLEFTESPLRLRNNISSAIDISDAKLSKVKFMEKTLIYLTGLPERTMMITAWMPTFRQEFESITGVKFNDKSFKESKAYREQYGKAVKEAAAVADAQTEKIIGTTTKAGQRRQVRIAPKLLANLVGREGTVDRNSVEGQILGFFSNYSFREITEFINGFREFAEVYKNYKSQKAGNAKALKEATKRLSKPLGIVLNIATYGYLTAVLYALELILLGDDEEEEKGFTMLERLTTVKGFGEELTGNLVATAASKYSGGGRIGMQLMGTLGMMLTDDPAQKESIKNILKESVYVKPLPVEKATQYGGKDSVMASLANYIPHFALVADRIIETIESGQNISYIWDKVEKNGVESLSRDEGAKVLALNTMLNTLQAFANAFGTSVPAYNKFKRIIRARKKEAGVDDIGTAPSEKKKAYGGFDTIDEFKLGNPKKYEEYSKEGGLLYEYRKKTNETNTQSKFAKFKALEDRYGEDAIKDLKGYEKYKEYKESELNNTSTDRNTPSPDRNTPSTDRYTPSPDRY